MFDTCSFKPTNDGFPPSSGGGGGAVDSVFGRTGVVIAVAGDYTSSEITNSSTVTGTYVTDALNTLDTTKASLNSAVTFGSSYVPTQFEIFSGGQVQVKSGNLYLGSTNISGNFAGYLGLQNSNGTVFETYGGDFPSNINFTRRIQTLNATYDAGTVLTKLNSGSSDVEWGLRNISDYAVSKTLTNGNIIVGNGSNVATAVAMSGDATIINTGALTISNQAVTFAKMQHISSQHLVGRHAAGSGDIQQISLGTGLSFSGANLQVTGFVPTTLTSANIIVGNNLGVATAVAMSGDTTISNTGAVTISNDAVTTAKILNSNVTFAKIQNATTNRLIGRATAGAGVIEEITLGTNLSFTGTTLNAAGGGGYTYLAITLSVDTSYNKAALGGANYLLVQTNNTTTRILTIGTGYVANDFIVFAFADGSQGSITLSDGVNNFTNNRGNTIFALFNGTTWVFQSWANAYNSGVATTSNMSIGLGASSINGGIAIGSASSASNNSVSVGTTATGSGANTVRIGAGTQTGANTGVVAIGQGITNTDNDSVTIGRGASATSGANISIGATATTTGTSIAIGNAAQATGSASVTVGASSTGSGANSVRIGNGVTTGISSGVVAIGQGITTTNTDAVVIGREAIASGTLSVVIGRAASASTTQSIAIGFNCQADGAANVTIGGSSTGTGANCVRVGNGITTGINTGVVAIGQGIITTNVDNVIIGRAASAGGAANVTIGGSATGTGANCVRIGNGVTTSTSTGVVAIGQGITNVAADAVIIGRTARADDIDCVAIGLSARAGGQANITLGASSNGTGADCIRVGYAIVSGTNTDLVILGNRPTIASSINLSSLLGNNVNLTKTRQFAKGAYAYPRHYGAESRRIDTNNSSTDATNPTRHSDNTAWNGSTNGTTLELLLFAQTGEYLTVQNNELLHFMVMVSAKKEGATDSRVMIMNGAAVATGGVASLIGSGTLATSDFNNSAGAAALTATLGVTSNRITMTVDSTNPASTGVWQWTANIINITRTRTA